MNNAKGLVLCPPPKTIFLGNPLSGKQGQYLRSTSTVDFQQRYFFETICWSYVPIGLEAARPAQSLASPGLILLCFKDPKHQRAEPF